LICGQCDEEMFWDKDYDDKGKSYLIVGGHIWICPGCTWYVQTQGTKIWYCENCDFSMMWRRYIKEVKVEYFQCLKCGRILYENKTFNGSINDVIELWVRKPLRLKIEKHKAKIKHLKEISKYSKKLLHDMEEFLKST